MSVYLSGEPITNRRELIELYRRRLAQSGFTSETLFYKNPKQHDKKLQAYARLVENLPDGHSLLDVGCGYGELLRFTRLRGQYTGIDLVAEFVDEARRRNPDKRFEVGDLFERPDLCADWVVLAGVLSSVPESQMLLTHASKHAYRGVLFDVTIGERLPGYFTDLSRWSKQGVMQVSSGLNLELTETYDIGETWIIFRGELRPTAEPDDE